jgi:hypothetical protein
MEFEVTPAFPTLIGRFRLPDADGINQELQALIIAEEAQYPSLGRSNIGGWHSRPDFLSRRDPAVSALTAWLNWALRRMIDAGPMRSKVRRPLPRGRPSVTPARTMHHTLTLTALGPVCTTWIPEPTATARPSPVNRRVGIHDFTFEACSSFTRVTTYNPKPANGTRGSEARGSTSICVARSPRH